MKTIYSVSLALCLLGCTRHTIDPGSDPEGEPGLGGAPGDEDSNAPPDSPAPGSVVVSGRSESVGHVSYEFAGPSEGESGNEAVSCRFHPSGVAGSGYSTLE